MLRYVSIYPGTVLRRYNALSPMRPKAFGLLLECTCLNARQGAKLSFGNKPRAVKLCQRKSHLALPPLNHTQVSKKSPDSCNRSNMSFMTKRFFRNLAAAVALTLGLNSCLLPASFDMEIEISRSGYYSMVFEGYLAEVILFNDIEAKKLTRKEEAAKVKKLIAEFKNDPATKEVSYFKQGHFKIKWQKSGDILVSKMVAFFRRNENMFSIIYNKKKALVSVQGTPISRTNAKRLTAAGLGMTGQIRVKTDARVIKHNAAQVKKAEGRYKIYIWNIKSPFDPAPSLLFNLR